VAEVKIDNQDSVRGDNLGDPDLAAPGQVDDVKLNQAEHSAEPTKVEPTEHSAELAEAEQAEHSAELAEAEQAEHSAELAEAEQAEHSAELAEAEQAEHSAELAEAEQAEHSAEPTEHSAKTPRVRRLRRSVEKPRRQSPKSQPVENKNNVFQLSAQRGVIFDKGIWKRSGKKEGYLIRRLPGYSIAETEYGVSYLWVLSRKPDRTTADNSVHPLAGYFNWKALEASGLFCKERKNDKRDKTAIAG